MRIIIKIILFPISIMLTIIVALSCFLVEKAIGLMGILSSITFIVAMSDFSSYFFGWPYDKTGDGTALFLAIFGTVMAFIVSPFGLPILMLWLVDKLDDLNIAIKSI